MKKVLFALGVVTILLALTSISAMAKTSLSSGPGDGVTSCEVYGAPGYYASVDLKVIVPNMNSFGELSVSVSLNQENATLNNIYVVVQLRDFNGRVIESRQACFKKYGKSVRITFDHKGQSGEAYYVTIDSASCK